MSYYQYMQSVYSSCLPQLNRSLRSSSVERQASNVTRSNYYSSKYDDNSSRYYRAATVGPTDYVYTSAMPFTMEAEKALERLNHRRAQSVEPVLPKQPFSYVQHYSNYHVGKGYSAFDYKVFYNPNKFLSIVHSVWKIPKQVSMRLLKWFLNTLSLCEHYNFEAIFTLKSSEITFKAFKDVKRFCKVFRQIVTKWKRFDTPRSLGSQKHQENSSNEWSVALLPMSPLKITKKESCVWSSQRWEQTSEMMWCISLNSKAF